MKNVLGREVPEYIDGYGNVKIFQGAFKNMNPLKKVSAKIKPVVPGDAKLVNSLEEVLDKVEIRDGMCISFHHHLRNGDYILSMVVESMAKRGIKNLTVVSKFYISNS